MWCTTIALLAWVSNSIAAPAASQYSNGPTAKVENGTYVGLHSSEYNQDFFLGIPYAQPPVGDLRFRNPQSLNKKWAGFHTAQEYSPECVGYGGDQVGYEVSEDCLYLNVIRPSGYEHQKLPVGFWIHGGGYYMGGGVDKRYNLSFIVENSVKIGKPMIGVSINYRLGTWGFLNSEEIVKSGNTNMGLRDQRLAMHWVQENIAAFGGDPKKVTIWGESAGASSVGNHLVAYGGRDDKLFRAGIMQSGSPVYYSSYNTTDFYQTYYDNFTSQVGCSHASDSLQCLRKVDYATLNNVFNSSGTASIWHPFIDGDFLQKYASIQLREGNFVKVPIISGANSNEGTGFSPVGINNTAIFRSYLENSQFPRKLSPAFAQKVLKAYPDIPSQGIPSTPPLPADFRPGYPYGGQFRRSAAYYGDATFIAPRRLTCQTWASNGVPAYCYRFDTIPAGIPQIPGATHFQEVAFVFLNLNGNGNYVVNPFEGKPQSYIDLAYLMSSSWASFVHELDPNAWRRSEDAWPKYNVQNPKDWVFDANATSLAYAESDTYRKEGMALINAHHEDVYHR